MRKLHEYIHDPSGHALIPFFSRYIMAASFYVILILGGLTVVAWPWKGFVGYMKDQHIPYSFPVVFIGLLVLQTYLHLRLGRGEIGINYHFLREKIHQQYLPTEVMIPFIRYGFMRCCLQILVLLGPTLPILLLATALSGFSMLTLAKALSVVATAALVCRLWGFFLYELWGNSSLLGYFLARIFLAGAIYLSGFLHVPVNPIRIIYQMNLEESLSPNLLAQPYVVYMITAFGCIITLTILCEWRGRHHRRKELVK